MGDRTGTYLGLGTLVVAGIGAAAAVAVVTDEAWRRGLLRTCIALGCVAVLAVAYEIGRRRGQRRRESEPPDKENQTHATAAQVSEESQMRPAAMEAVSAFLLSAYKICHATGEALTAKENLDKKYVAFLFLLHRGTTQSAHTDRRASIMVIKGSGASRTMDVRTCYPDVLFENEVMSYPEAEFATQGGLCWLVEERLRHFRWGGELPVVYISDTTNERRYRRGVHDFKSIMLAPI
jgi:hypothetical protein